MLSKQMPMYSPTLYAGSNTDINSFIVLLTGISNISEGCDLVSEVWAYYHVGKRPVSRCG